MTREQVATAIRRVVSLQVEDIERAVRDGHKTIALNELADLSRSSGPSPPPSRRPRPGSDPGRRPTSGARPSGGRNVLRRGRGRPAVEGGLVANPDPAQHRRAVRIEPAPDELPARLGRRRREAGPSELRFRRRGRRRGPPVALLVALGRAAIVVRWRRAVEVGGQRRSGGEQQGAESGAPDGMTEGHWSASAGSGGGDRGHRCRRLRRAG